MFSGEIMSIEKISDRLSEKQIWQWLEDVPDPEIPVISVVDLGIVRDVSVAGDQVTVMITPTYSGCPATTVISFDIEAALRARGVADIKIASQLFPPWTTDWISEAGREKLLDYGIAPPQKGASCAGALRASKGPIACPQCGSVRTECVSEFGSTPCKAAYRCLDCLEPFDYFKTI